MNTLTKFNLCLYAACTCTLLCVFSKPLHLSDTVHWALTAATFVFLYPAFRYIKQMKAERAEKILSESEKSDTAKKIKRANLWIIVSIAVVSLFTPLWLPFTGASLGIRGDTVLGITNGVILCVIFVAVKRKQKQPIA